MAREIERRLSLLSAGSMLPFTVLDPAGTPVGMTTFMNVDAVNHRVEIGSTWYAARVQRTALNTECKLLMLTHAFDTWGAERITFKTDARNSRSRAAIERLGAQFEGIRRVHLRASDGGVRDTAYYSIIRAEWPDVRTGLEARLAAR